MSVKNLDALFKPRSVAIVGASANPGSLGTVVTRNLLATGFEGPVFLVNPRYSEINGMACHHDVADLPDAPDLAVICSPAGTVPAVIGTLASRGTRAAVVISSGISRESAQGSPSPQARMLAAARPGLLRIVGPNCIGIQNPPLCLNASFAHLSAKPGSLAFVSQSGAMIGAVLDWAAAREIGFSHVISLGDMADVDFGDTLDYLACHPQTTAILLYMEGLTNARKFMSAARAAARLKPVVVIKAGRHAGSAQAVASHTGALSGQDGIFDAAFRRAGLLRVADMQELFAAAGTLLQSRPLRGDRLAILSNGGGPAVLAIDALLDAGGSVAPLAAATVAQLDSTLPATWSHANPVDIVGDAGPDRYREALSTLLSADENDAVLVINCPTAAASSEDAAVAVTALAAGSVKPVLACWLGEGTAAQPRRLFAHAHIPSYETPELAIRGFMHLVHYRRNQQLLLHLPASTSEQVQADPVAVRAILQRSLATEPGWLPDEDVRALLQAYGIPFAASEFAATPEQAEAAARRMAGPCVLKIVSPAVTHKSDAGGVVLDLATPAEVRAAAEALAKRWRDQRPGIQLAGFTVQPMIHRPDARELIVGVKDDAQFGPVVLFGSGGVSTEVVKDVALEFPPLNTSLAMDMIARTRVAGLLRGYRNRPGADFGRIADTLIRVAQMAADCPEIVELDINPLLADADGVIALDARIRVARARLPGAARLAIRPYPRELERLIDVPGWRRIRLRPVRPDDAPDFQRLFRQVSPEDIRQRFFVSMRHMPDALAVRLTQIDYEREMAFVATDPDDEHNGYGVVRLGCDPDLRRAELSVIVRSDVQRRGLGRLLLEQMLRYAGERGVREVYEHVLAGNVAMLALARRLGFRIVPCPGDPTEVAATLTLPR